MAQEARNTERHDITWGNARLRNNAVAFVSAGNLVREEPESTRPESPHAADSEKEQQEEPDDIPVSVDQPALEAPSMTQDDKTPPAYTFRSKDRPSSTDSSRHSISSGSDEVVFQGRNSPAKPVVKANANHVQNGQQKQDHLFGSHNEDLSIQETPAVCTSTTEQPASVARETSLPSRPRRRWEMRHSRRQLQEEEEEAIMQDYIDNMALGDDDDEDEDAGDAEPSSDKLERRNETFRFHTGSGEQNAKVQLSTSQPVKRKALREDTDEWDSADLDDLNDLSTTDDDISEVGRVLRCRERPLGKQYLVTAVGTEIDEAKWVAHTKLVSATAIEQIQIYEEVLLSRLEASADVSSSEDEEIEDLIDDVGSEQDENERIIQQTSRMTDEQIARALAKQEQLGMGGEEVLLFDGQEPDDFDDDDDIDLDEFMNGDNFIPFSMTQHTSNRGRSKRNKRSRDSFPSAGAFADALDQDPYGGFDIMDFDRPSLRPKRKGRKSDFPYDLEDVDEELAHQLMNSWTKDREKKAARKHEKIEAEQAMLIESAEGSNPAVIKARVRQFLVSEADTLTLTTMDAPLRASVHRLAKALKLNSKSQGKDGKGLGRYPVLTKTPYTPYYTVNTIFQVDALLNMPKFFPKHLYKGFKSARTGGAVSRRQGGGVSAASYANGDVVGASAPEIGQENRGRAMLEKMGWSVGMGIGKEGNKGSIDSVKHVVKTNKAGLG